MQCGQSIDAHSCDAHSAPQAATVGNIRAGGLMHEAIILYVCSFMVASGVRSAQQGTVPRPLDSLLAVAHDAAHAGDIGAVGTVGIIPGVQNHA